MLIDGLAIHQSTLETVAGDHITYSRGSASFSAVAIIARRKSDTEENQQSAALTAKIVDWLIRPSSFGLGEPRASDEIRKGDGRIFEVRAQGNIPCWEWSDPRHTFIRIHTVEQKQQVT